MYSVCIAFVSCKSAFPKEYIYFLSHFLFGRYFARNDNTPNLFKIGCLVISFEKKGLPW